MAISPTKKTTIIFLGTTPEIRKITFRKHLKDNGGISLRESGDVLDEISSGHQPTLDLPFSTDAQEFVAKAQKLGVVCRVKE